ncbi:MAG TPA: SUMF1/EgtB/PvdO family nonheme iron enzyme, partial [Anaerolineae bacterium]|nr:SUMF1/EgtB/PvdO family nonheme iron enzyme [Anaerolineae bacterium]
MTLNIQTQNQVDIQQFHPSSFILHSSFVHIPAGPFIYGPEVTYERLEQAPPPRPRQVMELDEFWIARYPVTFSEWKKFLDATGFRWLGNWYTIRQGWRGWLRRFAIVPAYPAEMARYPIVDVSQADAL